MNDKERVEKVRVVLSNPRSQADEVRALQDTIYVVGGKWRLPIINSLCNGNKRFREIERSIPGLSTRMLSRELKDMEANGLIRRTVYDEIPVVVEYTVTDYCRSFGDIILEMIKWGKAHRRFIRKKEYRHCRRRGPLCGLPRRTGYLRVAAMYSFIVMRPLISSA